MKIVFVVNNAKYFISHRFPIGLALIKKGIDVHVIAPGDCPFELSDAGFNYHSLEMSRDGMNPLLELWTTFKLYQLFRKLRPDLLHLVAIKPNLFGGIASRMAGIPAVVSAVPGLGILFSKKNFKNLVLRCLLYPLYKIAFQHSNQVIIFQNADDRDVLFRWGVLDLKKTCLIRGAGVNLRHYYRLDAPEGVPVISLASRMLRDKGVFEFVAAAKILKSRGINARFWLIGEPDLGNSNSVTQGQLDHWHKSGLVECLGYRTDIADIFAQSNIVTLPSYYGEGLPKVLLEAAASGRAVVTTDQPGCRDAIEDNKTGVLVPVRDAGALAEALQDLINNTDKCLAMGRAGRNLAEREFSIEKVVDMHLKIYSELVLE